MLSLKAIYPKTLSPLQIGWNIWNFIYPLRFSTCVLIVILFRDFGMVVFRIVDVKPFLYTLLKCMRKFFFLYIFFTFFLHLMVIEDV